MEIREVQKADLIPLLKLYTQLTAHGIANETPIINETVETLWGSILNDKNHHIIVGIKDGVLISSCVIVIVPNLTHKQRPYALIENVVTDKEHRGKGYATAILNYAKEIAINNNCYKIMLLTGTKKESTLKFYEKAGYNSNDKTAFIQWL
jgi:GNAT superfamily N-acetyltransferase